MSIERSLFPPHVVQRAPSGTAIEVIVTPRGAGSRRVLTLSPPTLPIAHRIISVTEYPVEVTTAGAQDLRLAVDLLGVDELDLQLRLLRLTSGGHLDVELLTGMQRESESGWVSVRAFSRQSAAPASVTENVTGLLRYLRWNVTSLGGASATFMLRGIGRRWSPGGW